MGATYTTCGLDVQDLAEELIKQHHDHLLDVSMRYVFRDEAARSGGKTVLGKARKLGGLNAHLAGLDEGFVVELAGDIWPTMNEQQQRALVDHELSHCRVKYDDEGERKLWVAAHDLEEFVCIVERYGLWKADVKEMAHAMQPSLFESLEVVPA